MGDLGAKRVGRRGHVQQCRRRRDLMRIVPQGELAGSRDDLEGFGHGSSWGCSEAFQQMERRNSRSSKVSL